MYCESFVKLFIEIKITRDCKGRNNQQDAGYFFNLSITTCLFLFKR